jgi:glycosyltransferase involved in cell wall biosynthesis
MSSPYFSVVIPTYNSLNYLKRSLSSVVGQIFEDFEVIIVDNSSKDGTTEYLESIRDKRVLKLKVQNYGVIGYSRNIGISEAKGDWIAFLDSDDEWFDSKLYNIHRVLQIKPNLDVIVHSEDVIENNRLMSTNKYGNIKKPVYDNLLFVANQLSTSATVVRASVLKDSGGFSEDIKYATAEDYELWLRLAKSNSNFYFHDEVLGKYYRFKGTASTNVTLHIKNANSVFYDHLHIWASGKNISSKELSRIYNCRKLFSFRSSIKQNIFNSNYYNAISSLVSYVYMIIIVTIYGDILSCIRARTFGVKERYLKKK